MRLQQQLETDKPSALQVELELLRVARYAHPHARLTVPLDRVTVLTFCAHRAIVTPHTEDHLLVVLVVVVAAGVLSVVVAAAGVLSVVEDARR